MNTPNREYAPYITDDGQWLYFHSNRPGGCGGQDLWVTHREDTSNNFGWETPVNLSCKINTNTPPVNLGWTSCPNTASLDQAGPTYFKDAATGTHYLYFTQRPTGGSEDCFDIYVSTCDATNDLATCNTQGLWGPGVLVDELSVPSDSAHPGFGRDTRTAIRRRDGLEMILSSKRVGGVGLIDLWSSTRPSVTLDQENWSVPINLAVVNSPANDGAPALSWDGTELYFYSDRTDLLGHAGGTDLYISKRNVEYAICPLYDQSRSVHGGATFPIKLQLCDANGNDLSDSTIFVKATSVTAVSGFSGTPDAPGDANPDNDFRFDATLGPTGGYIFNLSTAGLASGTYSLQFTARGDPVAHSVNFGVN